MPEVTIRRCVMRMVRRGGWSWGPDPRRLAADAMRALPALLAAELERLLPEDAAGEITEPLRVDVRVSLAELRSWARDAAAEEEAGGVRAPSVGTLPSEGAVPALVEAMRRGLSAVRPAERLAAANAAPMAPSGPPAARDACGRAATVLNLLVAWRQARALEELLRDLPEDAVVAWHRALFDSPDTADGATGPPASREESDAVLGRAAAAFAGSTDAARMRARLLAAVEWATELGAAPTTRAARAAIDAALPLDAPRRSSPASRPAKASPSVRIARQAEVRVSSALPFLLLGPLHGIGWLDLMESTFAAADLLDRLPALATALATKVLPPPERGWRRRPDSVAAAAAFAGRAEPCPDPEVADLARVAGPFAPALDAAVRRSLIDGRAAADPVLLCSAGGLRLCIDPPGLFVLAHAATTEEAAARARETGAPVYVPEEDADTDLLASLDAASVTFVTPARPVREERWRALPGTRAPRLFSNGTVRGFRVPPAEAAADGRLAWEEMQARSLPGRPVDPRLDRALALAAALALSTIAWELWRTREATGPLLALERLGDLEATVRFEDERVRVRLPLGKRYRDLKAAGFLEDVPALPWLGERPVVFAGG